MTYNAVLNRRPSSRRRDSVTSLHGHEAACRPVLDACRSVVDAADAQLTDAVTVVRRRQRRIVLKPPARYVIAAQVV